jgi:hypothetical protein
MKENKWMRLLAYVTGLEPGKFKAEFSAPRIRIKKFAQLTPLTQLNQLRLPIDLGLQFP